MLSSVIMFDLRISLDNESKRTRPASTLPPNSLNVSPLCLTKLLYSLIVIPDLAAALPNSRTEPPKLAPELEAP